MVPRDAARVLPASSCGNGSTPNWTRHPLRREIIATVVANDMINMGGITFAFRAMEETSATEAAVAKAFVALREVYELDIMVDELNELPASFPTEHWSTVHLDIRRLLDRAVRWLLTQGDSVASHRGDRGRVQAADGSDAGPAAGLPARRRPRRGWRHGSRRRGAGTFRKTWRTGWAELFESFVLLDIAKIVHVSNEPVAGDRPRLLHGV